MISVLRDLSLVVDGNDLSNHVKSCVVENSADAVEKTAMGDDNHTYIPGLKNNKINGEMYQDYASGSVDEVMSPLVGATGVVVVVKPTSAGVGPDNPTYTVTAILTKYQAVGGQVGAAHMTPFEFSPQTKLVRATM